MKDKFFFEKIDRKFNVKNGQINVLSFSLWRQDFFFLIDFKIG